MTLAADDARLEPALAIDVSKVIDRQRSRDARSQEASSGRIRATCLAEQARDMGAARRPACRPGSREQQLDDSCIRGCHPAVVARHMRRSH